MTEANGAMGYRAPVDDSELQQWADLRSDDAGRLAKELAGYRRAARSARESNSTLVTAMDAQPAKRKTLADAISFVQKRLDDYVQEVGHTDPETGTVEFPDGGEYAGELEEILDGLSALEATPPAPKVTEQRKFKLQDRVTKTKGSSWTGRVVGFYSTTLTPVGYAVESETETGSVQIYPEAALTAAQETGNR